MSEGIHLRLHLARPDFSLQFEAALPGSGITVLLGASGSGKTTLLRCVAGLERAHDARVQIGDTCWQDDACGVFVPPHRRDIGYVFQEASLFAHLDVRRNLDYGLRRSGQPGGAQALEAAIALLGIDHLLSRQVSRLSGGERQRVAIARALATQPRLLLLDEPLASLDLARRREILPWLERLRDELKLPMLYVTHAVEEAARLADHLLVLNQGRVQASGAAVDLLAQLDAPWVGDEDVGVVLQGRLTAHDADWHLARVEFPGGHVWLRDEGLPIGRRVRVRVLARDVSLSLAAPQHSSIQNALPGVVEAISADRHPSQALVRLRCGTQSVLARVTRRALHTLGVVEGASVWAQVKSVALVE